MSNKLYNKLIVFGIFVLFIGIGIVPTIVGNNNNQEISSLTFYTFDKSGTNKCKVELPTQIVLDISNRFEELKKGITNDPYSDETKYLKNDFVETIDAYGLIPRGLSKDFVISLLKPRWPQQIVVNPFSKYSFIGSKVGFNVLPAQYSYTGSAFFCSVAGGGSGMMFPPIMLPRPRFASTWAAFSDAISMASNIYTGHGFVAVGPQFGMALGFWGIGLSFAFPGEPSVFGFGGYALAAFVAAAYVESYPPNRAPVISEENPQGGTWDVPVSLSELSFRINDADGDRMSYWVTTDPDIGSDEGHLKGNGVYSVPVDGLEVDRLYSWTVKVSDGKATVEKSFYFISESGSPFDPFDEGWSYRKLVTINCSQVAGDLSDFPVLVSLVDSDLSVKAQVDGDDVLFMDGSGVASKLYHEIESYEGSSGELVCWVNIPSISSSSDTELYLYYGNSGCDEQQFPMKVWNSDFIHVWHLGESLSDSAGFDDGINHGTSIVPGMIGSARDFEQGESDYIDLGDMSQPADDSLTTMTWEAWIKPEMQDVIIMSKYDSSGTDYSSYVTRFCEGGKFKIQANSQWDWPGRTRGITDNSYSVIGQWVHLTGTYKLGSIQNLNIFVNGDEVQITQDYSNADYMWNIPVTDNIGRIRFEDRTEYSDAVIDEIRWSKIVRSDSWIKTSFNTMNDPSAFFSVDIEESAP